MLNSLQDLYVEQLRDLYSAESQLINALPKMAQAATSTDLEQAFSSHFEQTKEHKQRLEQVFQQLGISPDGEQCEAMAGLIKEGEEIIQGQAAPHVKDAALIATAQRAEHYEIAGYGVVRTFANELGMNDAKRILQNTLNEEGSTDKKLTKLAEGGLFREGINEQAER